MVMDRQEDIRQRARDEMERSGVLMTNGHFDYGNGFHGRVYLNPHPAVPASVDASGAPRRTCSICVPTELLEADASGRGAADRRRAAGAYDRRA